VLCRAPDRSGGVLARPLAEDEALT
jgi:hypothetical protein